MMQQSTSALPHLSNFINGQFDLGECSKIEIEDPSTGKIFYSCARATANDMSRAIDNATEGFKKWSLYSAESRFHILVKIASLLRSELPEWAALESKQTGRPLREG